MEKGKFCCTVVCGKNNESNDKLVHTGTGVCSDEWKIVLGETLEMMVLL